MVDGMEGIGWGCVAFLALAHMIDAAFSGTCVLVKVTIQKGKIPNYIKLSPFGMLSIKFKFHQIPSNSLFWSQEPSLYRVEEIWQEQQKAKWVSSKLKKKKHPKLQKQHKKQLRKTAKSSNSNKGKQKMISPQKMISQKSPIENDSFHPCGKMKLLVLPSSYNYRLQNTKHKSTY